MRNDWKRTLLCLAVAAVVSYGTGAAAFATDLVPVGKAVGINVTVDGVMVAGVSEVETRDGKISPAGQAGVLPGDFIVKLGKTPVHCLKDFSDMAQTLNEDAVSITVMRQEKQMQFTICPVLSTEGKYQLGLWLRDGITGIGTITYYDPETGTYGALGHGINDVDSGSLIPVNTGEIYDASIVGVVKGQPGTPGELNGVFEGGACCGEIKGNTVFGIFGLYDGIPEGCGDALPCGEYGEAQPGRAMILSTVNGNETEEFCVEIERVYRENGVERFLLHVTDERLLSTTGGIVQGMSGSPIIQDGKLIGAVTHVLTNDPTKGYGLGIQSMLDAAGGVLDQAA